MIETRRTLWRFPKPTALLPDLVAPTLENTSSLVRVIPEPVACTICGGPHPNSKCKQKKKSVAEDDEDDDDDDEDWDDDDDDEFDF